VLPNKGRGLFWGGVAAKIARARRIRHASISRSLVIRVEQGKGKNDRHVILSSNLLELLRDWWRVTRNKIPTTPGCFLATPAVSS
jgi:hypothetical protein